MSKKIMVTMLSAVIIMFNIASATISAEEKVINIKEHKLSLYPVFGSFKTEYTSSSKVDNVVPLAEDENAITLSLTDAQAKEIYIVSVFDITEDRYITSNKGLAVSKDKFIIKGLTGGHEYKIRACSLFEEKAVSGTITTGHMDIAATDTKTTIPSLEKQTTRDAAIIELSELDIIKGYEDGTFRLDNKITRAEGSAMLSRAIEQGESSVSSVSGISFPDVRQGDWFYDDVLRSLDFGIVNGYEDGTFKPQNNITYQEFIKMLVSMLFCDSYAQQEGGYPQGYLAVAKELGITQGIEITASDKITRGDTAIMISNAINTPFMLTSVFDTNNKNEYCLSDLTYKDFLTK